MAQTNGGNKDYVTLDFGIISNTGQRASNEDNTIVVEITGLVLNNTNVTSDGTSVSAVAGVRYGNRMVWVGQACVQVLAEAPESKVSD